MAVPHPGDLTGRILGDRYALRARLGEGGMGVVYRARDTMLRRDVAVKVFRDGATEVARTTSETRLLAGLNHPALVTLYDAHVGVEEPRYLVMEYVDGPTLQERLDRGPLSERTVARVARDLGEALHAVHQAGIVHRDVKPANVLLRPPAIPGEEFHAKLADFGIAYLIDTTRLTTPGTIVGSAAYLSPEQVTGDPPLPASDVYSLGLVLLEALTGQRAFAQGGMREAVLARLTQDPVVPSSVGRDWGALLTAMTAREPAERPTAMDVVVRVHRIGTPTSPDGIASSATVALPDAVAADSTRETTELSPTRTAVLPSESAADPERATAPARARWPRWTAVLALVVVLIAVIAGALAIGGTGAQPEPAPVLPALDEPLGAHLQQLLDAVSP